MANCNKCGSPLKADKQFCTTCGAKVEKVAAAPPSTEQVRAAGQIQCSKCKANVPIGKLFCTTCGAKVEKVAAAPRSIEQARATGQIQCSKCKANVPIGKLFCTACGNPMVDLKPGDVKPVDAKPADTRVRGARRPAFRIALAAAAVLVFGAGLFAVYTVFIDRKASSLDDQGLLKAFYGPPPFFAVIMAQDESQNPPKLARREVWVYPDRKVSFVFLAGRYQFSSDLKSVGQSVAKAASNLRIERITESLTVDDLSKLVGNKPVSVVNLPRDELPDAIRYEYGSGINAVFSQGRLLMVQIMPAQEGK